MADDQLSQETCAAMVVQAARCRVARWRADGCAIRCQLRRGCGELCAAW